MAKQIKKEEVYEVDLFEPLIRQGKELAKVLDENSRILEDFAKQQAKVAKNSDTNSAKGIKELEKATKNLSAAQKEKIKIDKQKQILEAKLSRANEEQEKELIRLKKLEQDRQKELKDTITLENKQVGTLEKLAASSRSLRREREKLNLETQEGKRRLQEINQELDKNNRLLVESSDKLKKQRLNVGNYTESINNASVGVKDFAGNGQGQGGSLISGLGGKLSGLTKKLGPVGVVLGTVAAAGGGLTAAVIDVEKQFNSLARQAQKATGLTGEALDEIVVKTKALSETFGEDTNELLLAQNTLIREFGVSAEDAFNIVSTGLQSSANAQGDLLDNIKEYSSQINASGGSANDLLNILDQAGKQGIFSDKGIDVVKEFGLRIREQTTATSDALKGAFGEQFTKNLLEGVRNGTLSSLDALKLVSKELRTVGDTAKAQTVIADVFGGPGEDAGRRFIEDLQFAGGSIDDLVDKNDPLIKQQQEQLALQEELARAQQEVAEEALGAGATLDDVVTKIQIFFFKALGGIVKFAKEASKIVTDVVEGIGDFIDDTIRSVEVFFGGDLVKNFDALTGAAKRFNEEEKLRQRLVQAGTDIAKDIIALSKEELTLLGNRVDALQDNNLKEEDRLAVEEDLLETAAKYNVEIETQNGRIVDLTSAKEKLTDAIIEEAKQTAIAAKQQALLDKVLDQAIKLAEARLNQSILGQAATSVAIEDAKKRIRELGAVGEEVDRILRELGFAELVTSGQAAQTIADFLDDVDERTKELNAKFIQQNKELNAAIASGNKAREQELRREIAITETELRAALQNQGKSYDKYLELLGIVKEGQDATNKSIGGGTQKASEKAKTALQKLQEELRKVREEQEALVDKEANVVDQKTFDENSERIEQLKKKIEDLKAILEEGELEKLEPKEIFPTKKEITEATRPVEEAVEESADNIFDEYQKLAESIAGLFEAITDVIDKQLDKQIAKQEEFITASQGRQDFLKQQAAEGNQLAKDSLAAEEAAEAKALAKKQQAERRKRQLESATIVLENISNLVGQGKSIGEATSISIASFETVKAILSNLPAFLDGTEDTGKNGRGIDNKGGFMSILHPNERVMTKEQNAMTDGMSNWELAELAYKYNNGVLTPDIQSKSVVEAYSNRELVQEMRDVKEAIKNKPVTNIEMGRIMSAFWEVHEKTIKGNTTKTKTHRFRK